MLHKLKISGLFETVTEEDVMQRFGHGNASKVELKTTPAGKQAFLSFKCLDQLKKCISLFNNTRWKGSVLKLILIKEPKKKTEDTNPEETSIPAVSDMRRDDLGLYKTHGSTSYTEIDFAVIRQHNSVTDSSEKSTPTTSVKVDTETTLTTNESGFLWSRQNMILDEILESNNLTNLPRDLTQNLKFDIETENNNLEFGLNEKSHVLTFSGKSEGFDVVPVSEKLVAVKINNYLSSDEDEEFSDLLRQNKKMGGDMLGEGSTVMKKSNERSGVSTIKDNHKRKRNETVCVKKNNSTTTNKNKIDVNSCNETLKISEQLQHERTASGKELKVKIKDSRSGKPESDSKLNNLNIASDSKNTVNIAESKIIKKLKKKSESTGQDLFSDLNLDSDIKTESKEHKPSKKSQRKDSKSKKCAQIENSTLTYTEDIVGVSLNVDNNSDESENEKWLANEDNEDNEDNNCDVEDLVEKLLDEGNVESKECELEIGDCVKSGSESDSDNENVEYHENVKLEPKDKLSRDTLTKDKLTKDRKRTICNKKSKNVKVLNTNSCDTSEVNDTEDDGNSNKCLKRLKRNKNDYEISKKKSKMCKIQLKKNDGDDSDGCGDGGGDGDGDNVNDIVECLEEDSVETILCDANKANDSNNEDSTDTSSDTESEFEMRKTVEQPSKVEACSNKKNNKTKKVKKFEKHHSNSSSSKDSSDVSSESESEMSDVCNEQKSKSSRKSNLSEKSESSEDNLSEYSSDTDSNKDKTELEQVKMCKNTDESFKSKPCSSKNVAYLRKGKTVKTVGDIYESNNESDEVKSGKTVNENLKSNSDSKKNESEKVKSQIVDKTSRNLTTIDRHALSNERRQKSVENWEKTRAKNVGLIHKALSGENVGVNKKIRFEPDSSDEDAPNDPATHTPEKLTKQGNRTTFTSDDSDDNLGVKDQPEVKGQPKLQLFEDSSEDEGYHGNELKVKPQFKGEQGQKLFEIQSKFGHDSRFLIDERFAESDAESDSDDEIDAEDERSRSLKIIDAIVGPRLITDNKEKDRAKVLSMLRYDPDNADHQQYERDIPTKPSKVPKISKSSKEVQEPDEAPKVDKKKFYEINTDIQISTKEDNSDQQPFSLTSLFGNVEVDMEPKIAWQPNPEELEGKTLGDPFKLNMDDEQIGSTEEVVPTKPASFFTTDEPLIQESLQFCCPKKSVEARESEWSKGRSLLLEANRKRQRRYQNTYQKDGEVREVKYRRTRGRGRGRGRGKR